jgi:uncharacterized protein YbcV (DUF1398 family)
MDANLIRKAAEASLSGTLPFPEIVKSLVETGVEYYFVDYAARTFTFYGFEGAVVLAPLSIEHLPAISETFDQQALKAAIVDSQQHGQKFQTFCQRAVTAGVQGYFAFLRGRRVVYMGRQGDQHIEWFPGSNPDKP